MAISGALSTKQARAISALLSSKTVIEAAQQADVAHRTLTRWLSSDQQFRQALSMAEGDLIDGASRRLLQIQAGAIDTIEGMLADDAEVSDAVRLRAAVAALDYLLKLRELRQFEQRLAALEQAFAERGDA